MSEREPVVIDASAVVELVLGGPRSSRVSALLRGKEIYAPSLLDAEVLQAIKSLERSKILDAAGAETAFNVLQRSSIQARSLRPLARDAWQLRHKLSIYDAMYVALAASLACPVVTCDRRWHGAGDLGVSIITV